jgi:hypothetical protein
MKALLKILLVLFVLCSLAAVALVLVLAFSPGLQRGFVVRALEANTEASVELEHVRVGPRRAELRGLKLRFPDQQVEVETLEARIDLLRLLGEQPFISSLRASGEAQLPDLPPVEFEVNFEETNSGAEGPFSGEVEIVSRMQGVAPTEVYTFRITPGITFDLATRSASLAGPFRLSGPESESNGTVTGKLDFADPAMLQFDLEVEADRIAAEELQPLLLLVSTEDAGTARDPQPDKSPPWENLEGQVTVRLGMLEVGMNRFSNLMVQATIEDGRKLSLETSGMSGSAPLKLDAVVDFQAEETQRPYVMVGDVNVQQFDVTPFLREAAYGRPPILEGAFNLAGSFQATAPNPAFLADRMIGSIRLQSAGRGIFRPLGENTAMAGGVAGLLGSLTGSIRELAWIQQVLDQLKEIPYTRMEFEVSRTPKLDFALKGLDLVSRETRIQGEGSLDYMQGLSLLHMPIDFRFDVSGKGRLAEALRKGNQLLSEEPDSLGFLKGPTFPVKGTLSEPESLLMNILMQSGSQLLPGLFR